MAGTTCRRARSRRRRRKSIILIMPVMVLACILIAGVCAGRSFAVGDCGNIRLDSKEFETRDLEETYITGRADRKFGQRITVRKGWKTVKEVTLKNTGKAGRFRIRIPAEALNEKGVSSFTVKGTVPGSLASTRRMSVRITYRPKTKQKIKLNKKSISLEFPGTSKGIKASASSGGKLKYKSKDKSIASVNARGVVTPKGAGETEIIVTQPGDEEFARAQRKVKVKVTLANAYAIVYRDGKDKKTQYAPCGETVSLEPNTFLKDGHDFLGWECDGYYYQDGAAVQDLAKKGGTAELNAVWSGDGIKGAIAWAVMIANDDSFNYGTGKACHKTGCYFCGTNGSKVEAAGGDERYLKTYVCLTFIGAAFAHGAEDPEILYACQHRKMPVYENDDNFSKFSCWEKIGLCSDMTEKDLIPGDIIILWNDYNGPGHVCMYIGHGLVVESRTEGWGPNSILVNDGKKESVNQRLKLYAGIDKRSYVMRYTKQL